MPRFLGQKIGVVPCISIKAIVYADSDGKTLFAEEGRKH